MRKLMLTGFGLCMAVLCNGALPTVQSVEKVSLPQGMSVSMATISPDGSYAVISPLSGTGLQRLDLKNGNVSEISASGSPMSLQISSDGSTVVYRENSYDNTHRRFTSLKAFNVNTGTTDILVPPTRNLQGFVLDGNNAIAVENGRKSARSLKGVETAQSGNVALSINQGKLYVTEVDGTTRQIAPLADQCGSYLWPSLSPDGKRIAAFGVGTGTFVCDLNGENIQVLGMYRAPVWLDNMTIVAMDDYDNGVETIKSAIMALSVDGKEKASLTDNNVVAVFPTVATNRVAFTTPAGELYIINLK